MLRIVSIAALAFTGCATSSHDTSQKVLGEDQVVHLMEHPKEWNGRVVTMTIYPYDNGFTGSYVVCFESCDEAYAAKSPFLIYTKPERFHGYKGDRSVMVTARYNSSCQYKTTVCPDGRYGLFTEVD